MIDKRRLTTAAVTLAVAFGTGYLMQNSSSVSERSSAAPENAKPAVSAPDVPVENEVKAELPDLPSDLSVPDIGTGGSIIHARRLAALDTGFDAPTLSDVQTPTPFEMACKPVVFVDPAPGAMIDIRVSAPCDGNARITVNHASLSFTDATDSDGNYAISIPAIQEVAQVEVVFDGGRKILADTLVLTVNGYNRSAIVWQGQPGLHIHALEFGADYGDAGDVWAEAARGPEHGVKALGGFLTKLGNPNVMNPKMAEVYSFPADRIAGKGAVRMVVEAEVTDATCDKVIEGYTIELGTDGHSREVALELAMPDCDAIGGYLVLKNLLQDMKIASN